GQALTFTFRPAAAGLVTVIVNAMGVLPPDAGHPDREGVVTPIDVAIQVELFKPGATAPDFSKTASQVLFGPDPRAKNRVIVWGDSMAAASDLNADWVVRLTSTGDVPAACDVTVRYQVMGSNLGKIDHIVVLMMENRSFDPLLGYLHLEQGRADVD